MDMIRVSAHSAAPATAGAIAGMLRETRYSEVQAIGANAVNQAIKAIAIARSYLSDDGLTLVCYPEFANISIAGKDCTAIRFIVEAQPRQSPAES